MDNPTTIEDVRGVVDRSLTPDEERTIPNWLATAWRTLNREVPGISARTLLPEDTLGHLDIDDVKDVVVAMVERKVHNSSGRRVWNGDDFSETVDNELSAGKIYVTEDEKQRLAPSSAIGGDGIFSIPLARF